MEILNIFKNLSFTKMYNKNAMAVLGDCLDILRSIKDNSINLIFADPPYGIGKNFGNDSDFFKNKEEYFEWAKKWIDECMRILKEDGTMYFMTSTQFMPFLDVYVDNNYYIINRIIWAYDSSGVQAKTKFGSLYEPILMVTHSKKSKYTFNYQDILIETNTGAKRKLIDYRKTPPQPYNTKKVPGNVWDFSRVRYRMDEYENHPTQKPEELLKRIILASSNENDIVLDPFSGSFTTSAVALKLNRKTIGIETNLEYFKIGLRRLNITDEYNGVKLEKDKSKKTKNKSKKDHISETQII
ncbi:adenine-specific DNA-methyltransferase [Leptotrichia trevisanii]|uniref:Methyltransferase n=1 Tax=Leptotrichia trevisanii TaxID=109328 RepID=A0A510K0K0_9FUSO|nr:adenine-specific DNA-methyltransferase [Leptotrichia trevisanii]BBM45169.1 methyltransferase [Leptotrichia trevisanii]